MFGLKNSTINIIINEISKFKEIKRALIFGSRAKGNYKQGSDIDIAIIGEDIDYNIAIKLKTILNQESSIPYYIDIVHYNEISNPELTEHIDRVGRNFFPKT
jgi:predicted nucleotidyltransferase